MRLPDYVKFFRGTSEEFKKIKKDRNTLYFICDPGDPTGDLYLGDKLISSCKSNDLSLEDISGINIDKVLPDDVLSYDAETGDWTATSLETLLSKISFPNDDFTFDGGEEI